MEGPHKMSTRGRGAVSLEEALAQVGSGWSDLVKEVYTSMLDYPGTELVQVKEKFGRLRIYWDSPQTKKEDASKLKPFADVIRLVETRSGNICEVCGDPGKVIDLNGWFSARCQAHSSKR